MLRAFVGYDPRQPLAANVCRSSIERHASKPVSVTSLILAQLPIAREGATQFSFSRFLVPYLSDYEGYSVFFDEDQVVVGDVHELLSFVNDEHDVWVVQGQPRFEWPSMMVFNNARCKHLTPEFVEDKANVFYDFAWAKSIGTLPEEWNHPVGVAPSRTNAKLYHYTQGIPYWPECQGLPEDKFWFDEYQAMLESVDWIDLHRNTKHFGPVMSRFLKRYGIEANFGRRQ